MHPLSLKSELIRPMTFAGGKRSLALLCPNLVIHGYPEWEDNIKVVYDTFKEYNGDEQKYSAQDDATKLVLFCWENPMDQWPVGSLLLMSFHFLYGGGQERADYLLRKARLYFCWEEIDEAKKLIHLGFLEELELRLEGLMPTEENSLGIVTKDGNDTEGIRHTITPHSLFILAARTLALKDLRGWEIETAKIRGINDAEERKKREEEWKKEEEEEQKRMEEMEDETNEESDEEYDEDEYFRVVSYDSDDE